MGDSEKLCRLLLRQASKEHKLYHLGLARIYGRQPVQGFIQFQETAIEAIADDDGLIQRDWRHAATTLLPLARASVVNEYGAHNDCRNRVKMNSIIPFFVSSIGEPKISFVNQLGGPKRWVGSFGCEVPSRDLLELLIDQWDQVLKRLFVAPLPLVKKPGNFRIFH